MSLISAPGIERKFSLHSSRRCSAVGPPGSISLCGGILSGIINSLPGLSSSHTVRAASRCPRCGGLKLPP